MKRPVGVTILAVLAIATGVAEFLWALASTWNVLAERARPGALGQPTTMILIPGIARSLLGLIYGGIGAGLLRLRHWARGVFMIWCGMAIGMVVSFLVAKQIGSDLWIPASWLLVLLVGIYVTCLLYLSLPRVKQAFRGK